MLLTILSHPTASEPSIANYPHIQQQRLINLCVSHIKTTISMHRYNTTRVPLVPAAITEISENSYLIWQLVAIPGQANPIRSDTRRRLASNSSTSSSNSASDTVNGGATSTWSPSGLFPEPLPG